MASISLNANVASLDAERRLGESTSALRKSFERLSSGLRINGPSDDAAGLAISESLKADSRILNQGVRNVNDGIGRLDIASADSGSSTVSILLGNGDGTFQARRSFAAGVSPNSVTVGGFNNDGEPDVATADDPGGTVSVLLGNGDGTFQAGQSFAAGASPASVSAGDFNGDGVLDLVSADLSGNSVSVLLGTSLHGVPALQPFSIATRDEAQDAMTYLARVQAGVASQRGTVGAFESRAQYAVSTLADASRELASARSRITDADVAEESATLVKNRILQQAGSQSWLKRTKPRLSS